MKKIYLMTAMAIAMTFTACSSSEDGVEVDNPKTPVLAQKVPVGFNAYANRGLTRSGVAGDLDLTALEAPAGVAPADGGGFGVFAYYTDLKKYDQTYIPNFMYNQGVFKNGANWEYTPVMYWPNESGSDAQSDDEDKVSFFAYAPYVKHTSAASGSVADATYGITGFSRNSTAGDPIVKYIASFDPAKSVDLCWGVCAGTSWAKFQGAANQTMQEGLPWTDVEHPQGIDQKMTFTFRHALSQLNVQIDADPDIATHNESSEVAAGTKVYVRSISFTGIATHGALNLNNTEKDKPLWLDYSGTTDLPYGQSVTVHDGRRDGREGAAGAEANNELPAGLNPQIVQNNPATTGVTHQLQNLFNGADVTTPVYVIPTGEKMTVSIVYDVETVNTNLSGYTSDGVNHGVSVENKITKDITWSAGTGLEAGKKYTLQLHLGLNSVQFDAAVAPWDDSAVDGSGWLPSNTATVTYMQYNPLWRVAEFNMKSNGVMHTDHGVSGEYLNVWTFADAQNINLTGYHLPTMKEQASIFPMDQTTVGGTIVWKLSGTLAEPSLFSEIASTVNGTDVDASTSYIGRNGDKDSYAVRFVGTDYASAWHYKWVTSPCAGLLIESYLVSASNETEAKTILAGLASSTTFTGAYGASAANQRPTDTAVTTKGFCQRFLPACGYRGSDVSGWAGYEVGTKGFYWSSTVDGSNGFDWFFQSNGNLYEDSGGQSFGDSVRLFHD
ncbi:MAG: fimbrillin family protein [Prevotella ruminicola]|uniref:Fimbrillin family protein n=1 Tax=Xylanibacter ruminicola TaxID=839 RepID=A0A9D5S9Q8_XYLRU|nr:fimbrillin family protein [Xylanibacter ruminicola]MBE7728007.1 fimbrillin family protein [Enterocloster citroniae]